jgi:hypothetical protein
MVQQYAAAQDFLTAIESRLQARGATPAIAAALASGVGSAETELRQEPILPGNTALNVRLGGFVIRDDDLPFLDALSAVAMAAAATVGTAGLTAPLVITAVTALAKLCWNAWRKGAVLNDAQVLVLGLLGTRGPMAPGELTELVRQQRADVDAAAVQRTLQSLKELELNDGRFVALASVDDAGTWRARAI